MIGDSKQLLPTIEPGSIQTCFTSPPYWMLRDYENSPTQWSDGQTTQLGLEPSPADYITHLIEILDLVRDTLKPDGTLWLNLGDSYFSRFKGNGGHSDYYKRKGSHRAEFAKHKTNGSCWNLKPGDLCQIPARVAIKLQERGWYLRSDVIWTRSNPLPESCRDRPTKAHEHLFLLAKSEDYYWDRDLNRPRKPTNVWETKSHDGITNGHKASGNMYIAKRAIELTTKPGDTVLDPFSGSGTTGVAANLLGRRFLGIDLHEPPEHLSDYEADDIQIPWETA